MSCRLDCHTLVKRLQVGGARGGQVTCWQLVSRLKRLLPSLRTVRGVTRLMGQAHGAGRLRRLANASCWMLLPQIKRRLWRRAAEGGRSNGAASSPPGRPASWCAAARMYADASSMQPMICGVCALDAALPQHVLLWCGVFTCKVLLCTPISLFAVPSPHRRVATRRTWMSWCGVPWRATRGRPTTSCPSTRCGLWAHAGSFPSADGDVQLRA